MQGGPHTNKAFLDDSQLEALLRDLVLKSIAAGSVGALCLTGLGLGALPVLQAYLDRTTDVQSVALFAALGSAPLLSLRASCLKAVCSSFHFSRTFRRSI